MSPATESRPTCAVDARATTTIEEAPPAAISVLDDSEAIELSIKPSLWHIVIASGSFVAACAVIVAIGVVGRTQLVPGSDVFVGAGGVAAIFRLVYGSLQWASQVYVLTNKRILRFSGVVAIELQELALVEVSELRPTATSAQSVFRLGTIQMASASRQQPLRWDDLARPREVFEIVERAVRRAQKGRRGAR